MRRYPDIDIVTDAGGAATVYSGYIRGGIESIQYVKDGGANPLAATADIVISDDVTGEVLNTFTDINATTVVRPRAALHDTAGAARLYAAGGTAVAGHYVVAGRLKIVVAQGGNAKVGKIRIIGN